jgi:ribonuclease Z
MDELELFFAGTGGAVPAARRGLPAIVVRLDGDRILFDCGEGTQRQLMRSIGLPDVDAIFLTHHHADHWLGLPGMLKTFDLRGREKPLDVFGPPGTQRLLGSLGGVWGRVDYDLQVTDVDAGDAIEFGGYEVEAFNVRHRGRAFGYVLAEDERPGRFDAARAAALGLTPGPDFGRLQAGESVAGVAPDDVVGPARPGRRVVLSGDTAPCDIVRESARAADVLVHEATFLEEDAARAAETGHSTAAQAARIAADAQPRLLVLTHLSTRYPPRLVREEAEAVFEPVHVARDFDAVLIPHAEKGEPDVLPWDRGARVIADGPERPAELL